MGFQALAMQGSGGGGAGVPHPSGTERQGWLTGPEESSASSQPCFLGPGTEDPPCELSRT